MWCNRIEKIVLVDLKIIFVKNVSMTLGPYGGMAYFVENIE